MKKLVKESIYTDKYETWDPDLMEKMLDEFEEKMYPLDEIEWEQIHQIKNALWIGYSFKNKSQ